MNNNFVWLVRQTQPEENYDNYTIAVFDNEEQALELARVLNKEYASGVILTDFGDFAEIDTGENLHYYDIKQKTLNPDMNLYL